MNRILRNFLCAYFVCAIGCSFGLNSIESVSMDSSIQYYSDFTVLPNEKAIIPMLPKDPIDGDSIKGRLTYYRGRFDSKNRLVEFVKYGFDGSVYVIQEIEYRDGKVYEVRSLDSDRRLITSRRNFGDLPLERFLRD